MGESDSAAQDADAGAAVADEHQGRVLGVFGHELDGGAVLIKTLKGGLLIARGWRWG